MSFGLLAGIGMAIGIRKAIYAQIIKKQIGSIFIAGDLTTSVNNIITGVLAFSAIVFFIYTRQHKGAQGVVSKIGHIGLMVSYGAIMGTFLMWNTSFSIGLIPDLVSGTCLYLTAVMLILILVDIYLQRNKTQPVEAPKTT